MHYCVCGEEGGGGSGQSKGVSPSLHPRLSQDLTLLL